VTRPAKIPWLRERPIAHRGLHDRAAGVIENSLSAAEAAIARNYAIECDVQLTRDGEAVVFHDDTLERLTNSRGRVDARDAAEIARMRLCGTRDAIPSLRDFLAAIRGRTPLVIELKSNFDGGVRLAQVVAQAVARYDGPVAIESFDPEPIVFLRAAAAGLGLAHVPLGIVAQARYEPDEWPDLSPSRAQELTHFLHYPRTRPDFLSWRVDDLPNAIPFLSRVALGLAVTVWTVRSPTQADFAEAWADQIVFEGFTPGAARGA
jgi:glycerophosphoryl diester phosphodiesterase